MEQEQNSSEVYFTGRPTGPDIDEIIKNYPVNKMEAGETIPYAAIEEIIHEKRETHRYKTVTAAWRKRLFNNHNIVIDADGATKQFVVLSNSGRVTHSGKGIVKAIRSIGRAGRVASRTPLAGLTSAEVRTRDHIVSTSASLRSIYKVGQRDLVDHAIAALDKPAK